MSRFDLTSLTAQWQRLSARERALVTLAMAILAAALLWWVALAPALTVWRHSAGQQAQLDRQQAELMALQSQARHVQSRSVLAREEATQALAQQTRSLLPSAQIAAVGERSLVTIKGASGSALAQWLAAIRQTAQASVIDAQLQRSPTASENQAQWDGQITVQLPQRGTP